MILLKRYNQDEKKIKIVDVDGEEYIGIIDEITEAEEYEDVNITEDGITIDVDGRLIEFMQSEINSIEIIK